ncbi:HK97-gp10 family putative phage morphogenesis protein [Rhizobium sp. BK060]|uniref:HK97-gp10 family putative phage morphogenesis protein n=1 Tax=Rhizobium sp. BK060 TaxID=2587096 RepID=UPI001619428E|nr:HK97-gp10 family putative phage morphogenesis protein [Rhizobium sp. BK060]
MVRGVSDMRKRFEAIPKRLETAAAAAMEKGAQELVDMMKRLVPVDSGALRDSIGWTWGDAPEGAKVITQSNADSRGLKITVYAGSKEAFYAMWVEFGTEAHTAGGKFEGAKIPNQPAHPFFFPAYRSLKKRIQSRIKRQTKAAMKFQGPPTSADV